MLLNLTLKWKTRFWKTRLSPHTGINRVYRHRIAVSRNWLWAWTYILKNL